MQGSAPVGISWEVKGEHPLSDTAVAEAVRAAMDHGERAGAALDVVMVSDDELAELHRRYLDDPTPTDVITFDLGEEGHGPVGELYVSVDRARARAAERGVTVGRELALYVVHGALHLCGFDDHEPDDRARMRAAERSVMGALGYPPDDGPHESDA